MAKEFLSQRGISFTEHNVAVDREKATEMAELTGQFGVPVIVVGEKVLVRFNPTELNKMLA
jgi:glutaredoxin